MKLIAPFVQVASHALHSMHSSGFFKTHFSFFISNTFTGHTSTHSPQPVHSFLLMTNGNPSPFSLFQKAAYIARYSISKGFAI